MLYAHTAIRSARRGASAGAPRRTRRGLRAGAREEPGERPGSATAVVRAVERALGPEAIAALGPPPPRARAAQAEDEDVTPSPPGVPRPIRRALRRHGGARLVVAVAVASATLAALVAGSIVSAFSDGTEGDKSPPLPARLGAGSDLSDEGVPVDCVGRTPRRARARARSSRRHLAGAVLVAPADGAVLGWTVRGARGEMALQILRPRQGDVVPGHEEPV